MNRCLPSSLAFFLLSSAAAFAQATSPAPASDGLALLQRAAQHYADAKSYRIDAVEEMNFHNDFQRNWSKTLLVAAEAPGKRYHYENRSGMGRVLRVGDGTTVWTYRPEQHLYTQKPEVTEAPRPGVIANPDGPLMRAATVRKTLVGLEKPFKSATRLADETLAINGGKISCYVVRVRNSDLKRASSPDYFFEKTFWIDKASETVVKISEQAHTYVMNSVARVPMDHEIVNVFTRVELNRPLADDLFTFVPPADAKLVEKFPNPMREAEPDLTGKQIPAVNLKSADGKVVALASYRGKPVLLDLWATWCPPCIEGLTHLARIYAEAKDKGLAVLTVDEDDEAKTATDFLASNHYTWANFHDEGEVSRALGRSGIPRSLVIDPQGKVIYDKSGGSEEELRSAVAKLGPEYASLAPKLAQAPCVVSK